MRRFTIMMAAFGAVLSLAAMSAGTAVAASGLTPWWHVMSGSRPSNLPPAREEEGKVIPGEGDIVVMISNLGDATASFRGSTNPVRIVDTLPAHVKATAVIGTTPISDGPGVLPCSLESQSRVSCEFVGASGEEEFINGLPPGNIIEVRVKVKVEQGASASGEQNKVSVSGGEGQACKSESESPASCEEVPTGPIPSASLERPLRVSGEPTRFGVENYELTPVTASGALDTQAGSHPFQVTFSDTMNQEADRNQSAQLEVEPAGLTKDLRFKLPPGLVGNPTPLPQCSIAEFLYVHNSENGCSAQTAIGEASVGIETWGFGNLVFKVPVFNLEPAFGEPARFGFYLPLAGFGVYIDTAVPAGGDYPVISNVENISQTAGYLWSQVTFWGTPGAASHNSVRGWGCTNPSESGSLPRSCTAAEVKSPPPFLDLPTSCGGALQTSLEADSWAEEGRFTAPLFAAETASLDGCNRLPFVPEIKVTPDGQQASKPTGLNVDVHVPQEGQLNGEGLAQSNIQNIKVVLPEGVTLNPSAADGLQACSEQQIGFEGYRELASEPGVNLPLFSPKIPGSFGSTEPLQPGVNFCPDESKIATAKIKTPLLPNPLVGAVYLASPQNFGVFPQENPFGTHVAMYIVAEDPVSGSLVKLPGKVSLNEATGQIESVFENNPQLPFEDAELHFFGGERAPLTSPSRCGTFTTNATYTPWSGGEPVHSSSSFQITSGPNGTPCPGAALPFNPTLASGTANIDSGSFSELTTTLSREDGQQNIQSVTLDYPPGISGLLNGVKLCAEAQANAGTCGPESEIGETTVSVGLGGDPFTVTGGKVYITEKYDGAPFGLSITDPAKAGPFNLQEGRPVVVRAKIEVNPSTAALTVTTDPSGAHAIPTIIEGFALQIKHVNVLINRPGFTFNPTNCTPTQITGAINSAEGASYPVKVPFQVTNCASLKFEPKFTASTSGKTSRANGASLKVKLTYPTGSLGKDANIAKVKVDLPRQLPSELKTLQHACTAAQFEKDPAGCPSASLVGHAKAITPLIPVPLEGPAIFVSHGGEAFPSLIVVLQGYGVTIDLVGTTYIDEKTGITSSTFKTVPDAPVGSFELNLPEGKYSALAANGNLCKGKLAMPTAFVAQNGAEIHKSTPITVTGCPKAKKTKTKKKDKKASGKGKTHGKKR